jgi:uncharacterized membrane protein
MFALGLALAPAVLLALFALNAIGYAYRRIGISEGALFSSVWFSLVGGLVNVPIARLRGRPTVGVGEYVAFGVRYRLPVVRHPHTTILAVKLGGALIPAGLSLFLLIKDDIWWQAAIAFVFVALLVHAIARPGRAWASPCRRSCRRCSPPESHCCSPATPLLRSPMCPHAWAR